MDKETLSNYGWVVVVLIVLALMISLATPFGSTLSTNIKGATTKLMGVASDSLNNVTKYESFEGLNSGEAGGGMTPDAGPTVVEGANQEVVKGEVTTLSFRSTAAIDTFQEVRVDGEVVARENYDVTEGSTVITFKESYLNSLAPGDHTIDIVSTVGVATSAFKVSINTALNPSGVIPEDGTYTHYVNSVFDEENWCWNYDDVVTYNTGDDFPEANLGDVYRYGDYEYTYGFVYCTHCLMQSAECGCYERCDGWNVRCIKDVANPGDILQSINGEAIKNMDGTFSDRFSFESFPKIPDTVVNMRYAFKITNVSDLSALKIPNSVTSMYGAFEDCRNITSLDSLVIPNSVTDLQSTFQNCSNIADISGFSVPSSVTNMLISFTGCSSLTGVLKIPCTCEGQRVGYGNVGIYHFDGCGH